jgi:hypothetical protein
MGAPCVIFSLLEFDNFDTLYVKLSRSTSPHIPALGNVLADPRCSLFAANLICRHEAEWMQKNLVFN